MARLHEQGGEVIIVSSGAIAAGRHKLGIGGAIKGIPYKQVLASVGQSRLMNTYEQLFGQYNITVAQALLTKADIASRAGYLNARNTLLALMELGVICIVNENDVVSIDEIKEARFGDNDNLSAMVANLVDADMLMILTDIGGLYTADPSRDPDSPPHPAGEENRRRHQAAGGGIRERPGHRRHDNQDRSGAGSHRLRRACGHRRR